MSINSDIDPNLKKHGFGLQPYNEAGDVDYPKFSTSCFARIMKTLQLADTEAILDVGCGNGRLNTVHIKYFSKIMGIDKFRNPDPRYSSCPGFEFKRSDIFEITDIFDTILFMGSFYLYHYYRFVETMLQAKNLLTAAGRIIIIEDKIRNTPTKTEFGYYNLKTICLNSGLKITKSFIQDDYLEISVIEKL